MIEKRGRDGKIWVKYQSFLVEAIELIFPKLIFQEIPYYLDAWDYPTKDLIITAENDCFWQGSIKDRAFHYKLFCTAGIFSIPILFWLQQIILNKI